MAHYTPRDWLVLLGIATLMFAWWVSFRMVREQPVDQGAGAP
jgi:hypothetical protein